MRCPRRRSSLQVGQVVLRPLTRAKLVDGLSQTFGVFRATKEIGGFLERQVILHRHHDDGLIATSSDNHRIVILTDPLHRICKILSSRCVSYCSHVDSMLYMLSFCKFYTAAVKATMARLTPITSSIIK
jgi:hypothetical protein